MKNRVLYLTIAGVLAAPAFAAAPQAEWSLYGTLVSELYNAKTTGAATEATNYAGRTKFTCATSNLGFKGSMKVADDVKVVWQIETAINQDGDYPGGGAGGIGTRNTAMGLSGSWGTVMAGQWDTPYKQIQMPIGHTRASLESDINIINNAGFNTMGTTTAGAPVNAAAGNGYGKDAAFNRRQGNSIFYWSPVVSGFQAKLFYSINENKTADATAAAQKNPTLLSGSLTYSNKALGLTVLYGYEQHNDYFGANVFNAAAGGSNSKDTGHELAVYYVAPTKTRITAIAEQLKYKSDGLTGTTRAEYERTAWFVSASHVFAGHYKVWAGGGVAGKGTMKQANGVELTSGNEFGAKQYQLGVGYVFNPNAQIYAFYGGVKNDANAQYNLMPQPTTVAAGADVRVIGIGMFYSF